MTTAKDGKKYKTKFYNLDLIISVGYRVRSVRGTQFRIWANKLIKEYLIKGYNLNVKRFKNNGGGTYYYSFKRSLNLMEDIYSSGKLPENIKVRCCDFKLLEKKCIEYNK